MCSGRRQRIFPEVSTPGNSPGERGLLGRLVSAITLPRKISLTLLPSNRTGSRGNQGTAVCRTSRNCSPPGFSLQKGLQRSGPPGVLVTINCEARHGLDRLNQLPPIPDVDYGDMDGLPRMPTQGSCVAGLDFQDFPFAGECLHRRDDSWESAAPYQACREFSFFPSGLGPSPVRNGRCVKEVLRAAPKVCPSLRVIGFVGDLGMVEKGGPREQLPALCPYWLASAPVTMPRWADDGGRASRSPGLGLWRTPAQLKSKSIRQNGRKGRRCAWGILALEPSPRVSARSILSAVSYRNFLQCPAPGNFCRPRSGWNVVNDSGVTDKWHAGVKKTRTDRRRRPKSAATVH